MGSPFVRSIVRGQYVFPRVFRWQLNAFLTRQYHPAKLANLLNDPAQLTGQFAVTFDDGYTSMARLACPILLEMRIPATLFIVVEGIGKTNVWDQREGDCVETMCTAAELRELAEQGFEIGSHSMNHPRLTRLTDAELRTEIFDSKKALEDLLGRPVLSFSYPYGEQDARVRQVVAEAGYTYATATTLNAVTSVTDPLAVPRVNMRWNTLGPELAGKLRRAYQAAEGIGDAHT